MSSNHASDPARAIAGAPADLVKILLAHQPITYKRAEPAGYNLQLSGHTHAGQYVPFTILIRLFQRYHRGLFKHGKMWIYVNPGTGFWGPPLRAGAAAEITEIVLRRAN
jgi:predicted MPP superfamily phosphohydrolase